MRRIQAILQAGLIAVGASALVLHFHLLRHHHKAAPSGLTESFAPALADLRPRNVRAPPGHCADELQACDCPHGKVVFGVGTKWTAPRDVATFVPCTVAEFGDPAIGKGKFCLCTRGEAPYAATTAAGAGAVSPRPLAKRAEDQQPSIAPAPAGTQSVHLLEPKVMHTFYQPRAERKSDPDDVALLAEWRKQWAAAGWQTRVATLADAESHPRYQSVRQKLDRLPLGPQAEQTAAQREYDMLCYVRHLATAHLGGGWVSDYDTMPLNFSPPAALPNGGKMTSYQRHVPSLMVGNRSEWERLLDDMLDVALADTSKPGTKGSIFSDMLALAALHKMQMKMIDKQHYYVQVGTVPVSTLDVVNPDDFIACGTCACKKAVHFSHAGVARTWPQSREPRSALIQKALAIWRARSLSTEKCNMSMAASRTAISQATTLQPAKTLLSMDTQKTALKGGGPSGIRSRPVTTVTHLDWLQNYKDVWEPHNSKDVAFFWHIPKAGGSSMKVLASSCHRKVIADGGGIMSGHDKDTSLAIWKMAGAPVVNIDADSLQGISRAARLGFAGSGLAGAVISSRMMESSVLFNSTSPGRAVFLMRHPVDRALSMFKYLAIATWEPTYNPNLKNMTIIQYVQSGSAEDNWMTRMLCGAPNNATVDIKHARIAMEILRQKSLIGLLDQLNTSVAHMEALLGWKYRENPQNQEKCREEVIGHGANVNDKGMRNGANKKKLKAGDPEWDALARLNKFDIMIYDYAKRLFDEQPLLFDDDPTNYRLVGSTCCKCDASC